MPVNLFVRSNKKKYKFVLDIHQACNIRELKLPVEFYKKIISSRTFFPRWEVEIMKPMVKKGKTGKLNYHYSDKDGKPYVCFPGPLPDIKSVAEMITFWAVGQVCVMELDEYFNELVGRVTTTGDRGVFIHWAMARHGIEISTVKV